jgi:Zn-dependent protease
VNADNLKFAAYLAVSLLIGMSVREYARAWMATRLGDPTPRLWGRLSWNPRSWFDPFGSGLVPGLVLVLWAAGGSFLPPPVAYAKPAPVDPGYLRRQPRDTLLVGFAGPVANVVVALLAGLGVRLLTGVGEVRLFLVALEFTTLCLAIFHLLPIPGLDGARLVALALPPAARSVYQNLDQYLALWVLVALFLVAGVFSAIVYSLVDALCSLFSGFPCAP